MRYEELMQKMQYLTVEEVEHPKLEIEHLINISPTLHLDNYLTYIIYLQYRPDLPDDEKELIQNIITLLKKKEDEAYAEALQRFDNKTE